MKRPLLPGLALLVALLCGCSGSLQQSVIPDLPPLPDIAAQAPAVTKFPPGIYAGDATETVTIYGLGDVAPTTFVRLGTIQVLGDGTVLDVGSDLSLAVGASARQSNAGADWWQVITNVAVSDARAVAALQVAYRDSTGLYEGSGQQMLELAGSNLNFSGTLTLSGQTADGTPVTQIIRRSATFKP